MKIVVDYDPVTKMVKGKDGMELYIELDTSQTYESYEKPKLTAKMVDEGYTSKELIQLKEAGVI